MPTARDFVTLAMKEAGVLGVGQTLLAEDINDGFTLLSRMMASWQKKRWLVPSLYEIQAIGNGAKSNLIGPGQYWNAARPDKIQAAYFKQLNAGSNESTLVSFPLIPIWSYEDYSLVQLKDLASWPQFYFYDGAFPNGNVFIWPIPDDTYEIHLILKSPIGFTIELEAGEISTAGTAYTNGTYHNIPLIDLTGFGSGATADITVAGGIITTVTIDNPGDGYNIGDQLTATSASIGGTGTGFIYTVTEVTDSLDAEFNMPPEYEEAIHYNLCRRLVSMYQYPPNKEQIQLAKASLNVLRMANIQVPSLKMPAALRFNNNNTFYIFNADAR
jgi:hypothetical protein